MPTTTEAEIWDEINAAEARMSARQRRLWEAIRIIPEKWEQKPYGNQYGGFWVVALIGRWVIWYNNIEDGFNRSRYVRYGLIEDYWCNQDELEMSIQQVLDVLDSGTDRGPYCGPPIPVL